MEPNAELLQMLRRQRTRMGEGASQDGEMAHTPQENRNTNVDSNVHVKQRCSLFEGSERQSSPKTNTPGKLHLGRWEGLRGCKDSPNPRLKLSPDSARKIAASPSSVFSRRAVAATTPLRAGAFQPSGRTPRKYTKMATPTKNMLIGTSEPHTPVSDATLTRPSSRLRGQQGPAEAIFQKTPRNQLVPRIGSSDHINDNITLDAACDEVVKVLQTSECRELAMASIESSPYVANEEFAKQIITPAHSGTGNQSIRSPDFACRSAAMYILSSDDPKSPDQVENHAQLSNVALQLSSAMDSPECEKEARDPMEYAILDYLDCIPTGLVSKLKQNLEMHDDLVSQLCRKNEQLRKKAHDKDPLMNCKKPLDRCLSGSSTTTEKIIAATHAGCITPNKAPPSNFKSYSHKDELSTDSWLSSDVRRRQVEAETRWKLRTKKVADIERAKLHKAAEAYEAAVRSKFRRACISAEKRVAAMTKCAEHAEEECRVRTRVRQMERERVAHDLERRCHEYRKQKDR